MTAQSTIHSRAEAERQAPTPRGAVFIYWAKLGGRLHEHQKAMLCDDAKSIARLLNYEFGGEYRSEVRSAGRHFIVPDDTLLCDEAKALGILEDGDFFGGVVPYPFVKTKSISHRLLDETSERPKGWSYGFADRVERTVLPGYTVFNVRDAERAVTQMLKSGPVRIKSPLGASGKGQHLVRATCQCRPILERISEETLRSCGVVLEANLDRVSTVSIGHIKIRHFVAAYYGIQRMTKDNQGEPVYGGSDLVIMPGGWEAFEQIHLEPHLRLAVEQAKTYDHSMAEYAGFIASRRNYDVAQGFDSTGEWRSGVLESSWRIGGASPAELMGVKLLMLNPRQTSVRVTHVEEYGSNQEPPAGAVICFHGNDAEAGPVLRYTIQRAC